MLGNLWSSQIVHRFIGLKLKNGATFGRLKLLVIIEGVDTDKISCKGVYVEKTVDNRDQGNSSFKWSNQQWGELIRARLSTWGGGIKGMRC